ncbi:MAG TPA: hypothetical protein O0X97_06195 [Methanocorpusculum sp.]|nr:hypothetical protein [Methanocorpusculum sp.]
MTPNFQYVTLTGDSAALLAALCRRRKAQIQIHIQARNISFPPADCAGCAAEKDSLADAAAAMYEAFAVAADIRIKRHEFEQKIRAYCEDIREDMAD